MDYLLKVRNKQELQGKVILVDEYLGADVAGFISEIYDAYPNHKVISYHSLSSEYKANSVISLLDKKREEITVEYKKYDAIIIDGWSHRNNKIYNNTIELMNENNEHFTRIEPDSQVVFIINRSTSKPNYKDIYRCYGVVCLMPLAIVTQHTHSLTITIRSMSIEVHLLYNYLHQREYRLFQQ
ncbi:hypothetical protein NEPAR06_0980 [Nematocida parisii]|uniref:Uncharacterized protein n=2 Tax=Nematocida parisii TaxID=586133 RepID=I3EH59_NEMP3|nr:hypothetical protein NEQG_01246 [Nematocida parisii ERTm3]KAI5145337.1 hypothetical protein NEPAR07_1620 [Nematocida parisii]KAI5154247.1 hypothetical protein NEPAR06_0980 [Nematocida parisii]KAI5157812.1 hypothetical protein NEPAR05_1611 [Nematocida parisii]